MSENIDPNWQGDLGAGFNQDVQHVEEILLRSGVMMTVEQAQVIARAIAAVVRCASQRAGRETGLIDPVLLSEEAQETQRQLLDIVGQIESVERKIIEHSQEIHQKQTAVDAMLENLTSLQQWQAGLRLALDKAKQRERQEHTFPWEVSSEEEPHEVDLGEVFLKPTD
jgi:hypothetical protein